MGKIGRSARVPAVSGSFGVCLVLFISYLFDPAIWLVLFIFYLIDPGVCLVLGESVHVRRCLGLKHLALYRIPSRIPSEV